MMMGNRLRAEGTFSTMMRLAISLESVIIPLSDMESSSQLRMRDSLSSVLLM